MGILKALFGLKSPSAKSYVDEGLKLTKKLITLLNLADWAAGTPVYTEKEEKVIDRELRSSQQMMNAEAQRRGKQVPESSDMQRALAADALRRLAGPALDVGWALDDECPSDWRVRVSTYLKAWAMSLDPNTLLEMAQLLALAGRKSEAEQAVAIVAGWFPSYAPRFFSASKPELVASITARARELMNEISGDEAQTVGKQQQMAQSKLVGESEEVPANGNSPKTVMQSRPPVEVALTRFEFDLLVGEETPSNRWTPSRYHWNISGDGPAIMPPSEEAADIREMMNETEKQRFYLELGRWYGDSDKGFPPEVRACIWGCALANLAQKHREAGSQEEALKYMHQAYRVCRYPMFANNAAYLALGVGNPAYARNLFACFLKCPQDTLEDKFTMMQPQVSAKELERAVILARRRLAEIEDELEEPNETRGDADPTEQQLKEALEAHKKGGDALLELLKKNREEREQSKQAAESQKPGYPSPELIQRYFEAYQKDGETGIRRVLREQTGKSQYIKDIIQKHVTEKTKDDSTK